MRRNYLLLPFLIWSIGIYAQTTISCLTIEFTTGDTVEYSFNEEPQLYQDNDQIMLKTSKSSVSFDTKQISKCYLSEETDTKIAKLMVPDKKISLQDDFIFLSGFEQVEEIRLYTAYGRIISTFYVSSEGELTIPISNLSKGVYIIKTENVNFKILRP